MSFFVRSEKDEDREQLSKSYLEMSRFMAWKHLNAVITEAKDRALKLFDEKSLPDITPNETAYIKGCRETVDYIQRRIDDAIKGSK